MLEKNNVKFVSYNAPAFARCCGTLVLEIDGEEIQFVSNLYNKNDGKHFPEFWQKCYDPEDNEWNIVQDMIPEKFQKYTSEIISAFVDNVPGYCCGGCL